MNVTITTDASYSVKFKRGSYAFQLKSNLGRIEKSGLLKGHIPDSLVAEMKSIYNALFCLYKNKEWRRKVKFVYINTDCLNAIHLIHNDRPNIKKHKLSQKEAVDMANRFRHLTSSRFGGVVVTLRHVKAHTGDSAPRSKANAWCDYEAKNQISKLYENSNHPSTTNFVSCRPSFTVQERTAYKK